MKTISIRDYVYEKLLRLKEEGESFSDVIEKLLEKKGFSLEEYFGCLKDSPALDKIAEYSRKDQGIGVKRQKISSQERRSARPLSTTMR